jgi:hypothetical protein
MRVARAAQRELVERGFAGFSSDEKRSVFSSSLIASPLRAEVRGRERGTQERVGVELEVRVHVVAMGALRVVRSRRRARRGRGSG